MVFESSCWASESSFVADKQTFVCNKNPVQRRPKVDYFNENTLNVVPNVSHISSNGYYGYCPTAQQSTQNIDVNQKQVEYQIDSESISQTHQSTHELNRESLCTESRKRSIDITDNFAQLAKRSRNNNEFIEDIQMSEDDHPESNLNSSMTTPMSNNYENWTDFGNNNHTHVINSNNNLTGNSSNIPSMVNVVDKLNESDQIMKRCHIAWNMMSHMT